MEKNRIYVEKKDGYQVEAKCLKDDLNLNLGLNIKKLRLLNVYDLFGFSKELLNKTRYQVFGEIVTDNVYDEIDFGNNLYLAVEFLPGQFDQRASSAKACTMLVEPSANVEIKSGKLIIFDDSITNDDLARIKKYYINAVEAREKNLNNLSLNDDVVVKPVKKLLGFTKMNDNEVNNFIKEYGLAMNKDDLYEVIKYFKSEGREQMKQKLEF